MFFPAHVMRRLFPGHGILGRRAVSPAANSKLPF